MLVFGVSIVLAAAYIFISEWGLKIKGFIPTIRDTEARWIQERARAAKLGSRALILVGASRIQLGMDLDVLRRVTTLEPVQLAIDGTSFVPILDGLARDKSITGTVVVDISPGPFHFKSNLSGPGTRFQIKYEQSSASKGFHWTTYDDIDNWIAERIRKNLSNFADSSRPLDSLVYRIANSKATPQYLVTLPDRSRQADYSKVSMPEFYFIRVLRHLGNPPELSSKTPDASLQEPLENYIDRIEPRIDEDQIKRDLSDLENAITAIQSRGGHVILISMPTSGLIRKADEKRYPREAYWNEIVANTSANTIYSYDFPELSQFVCPDGSHLDKRDRNIFTERFARIAGLSR